MLTFVEASLEHAALAADIRYSVAEDTSSAAIDESHSSQFIPFF